MLSLCTSSNLKFWWHASRPRFWLYLLGPGLLGFAAGLWQVSWAQRESVPWEQVLFLLLWLSFPLNLFVYGVNDLCDAETDALNPKKGKQEVVLQPEHTEYLQKTIFFLGILSVCIGAFLPIPARWSWWLCLFLSWSYSAPPLRWKAWFLADAYSNVLYVLPAWTLYGVVTQQWLSWPWFMVGLFWTAGMHTFSALPDRAADAAAGIRTTAVRLGRKGTLLFVGLNWMGSALLTGQLAGWSGMVLWIYPLLVVLVALKWYPEERVYWWFPWINAGVGMLAFWMLLFRVWGWW